MQYYWMARGCWNRFVASKNLPIVLNWEKPCISTGRCMENLKCKGMDTRDSYGRDRFLPVSLPIHLTLGIAEDTWLWDMHPSYYQIERVCIFQVLWSLAFHLHVDLCHFRALTAAQTQQLVSISWLQVTCTFMIIWFTEWIRTVSMMFVRKFNLDPIRPLMLNCRYNWNKCFPCA